MLPFVCYHMQALLYCPRTDGQTVTLTDEALETMVDNKWFGKERKSSLLRQHQNADAEGVPLSVHLTVGGPPSKFHISEKVSFPNKERVLQIYLHFEALAIHDYTYSCVSCGYRWML